MTGLSRLLHLRSQLHVARKPGGTRLRLEELESRTVLSVFTPAQIRHAYGFDQASFTSNGHTVAANGAGQTIAIVDAFDDPHIASDLAAFDRTFNITTPFKFTKVNQNGGSSLPAADSNWETEIALDVEWAHAIAPAANILLVEASSDTYSDLLSAVDYARNHASVVSMSWGGGEFQGENAFDSYFTTPSGHAGVTFVASSGDNGAWYGPQYPASSPNILAVGGTSLRVKNSAGSYGSESAWDGSGGGYSSFESEPNYQKSVQSSGMRTTPDVSYNADPNTGFYVLDAGTWYAVGGTSAGAPQWAALIAIADQGRALAGKGSLDGATQTLPAIYQLTSSAFHDVTSGSNGYSASRGYDLVTGRGSPAANLVIAGLVNFGTSSSSSRAAATHGSSGTSSSHNGRKNDLVQSLPTDARTAQQVTGILMQGTQGQSSASVSTPAFVSTAFASFVSATTVSSTPMANFSLAPSPTLAVVVLQANAETGRTGDSAFVTRDANEELAADPGEAPSPIIPVAEEQAQTPLSPTAIQRQQALETFLVQEASIAESAGKDDLLLSDPAEVDLPGRDPLAAVAAAGLLFGGCWNVPAQKKVKCRRSLIRE